MKLAFSLLALLLTVIPQTDRVHVLLIGEIRKIDVKNGVITIRERLFPDRGGRRPPRPPDLGPDFPPSGPPRGRGSTQDTKVVYSTETSVKSENKDISIGELKVGDSVQVRGRQRNKEFVA